ncbi:hypothetical protein COU76_03010 [Candidatus Peregrinibacteria bacterium CG10_big_fil_rev_8_21_14_0_10_49_10]|nr:MAG: hypothetical protein COU76_03010 [Candidatus Peregrinibacteria bacterium CG10_big_fil_rev_8_21_14_0_10_49_10]
MKRIGTAIALFAILCLGTASVSHAAGVDLYANLKKSTVLIASFDFRGNFISRGSGFYVDEGIVITNIHVIDGAARYYRIFTTGENDEVDLSCYTDINRSDIKLNLEDDIAYIRVFINCAHSSVFFAKSDAQVGDAIEVVGYPGVSGTHIAYNEGSVVEKAQAGIVPGETEGFWLRTDAKINKGNSGGPVVKSGLVVGVAVAAHFDQNGNALDGYFIPVSQIERGLEYANDSSFAYTPQYKQANEVYTLLEQQQAAQKSIDPFNPTPAAGSTLNNADCLQSLGDGAEATGYTAGQGDGCRCRKSYHRNSEGTECLPGSPELMQELKQEQRVEKTQQITVQRVVVPRVQEAAPVAVQDKMYSRVCPRVLRRFSGNAKMWERVNERIQKRFGFVCSE